MKLIPSLIIPITACGPEPAGPSETSGDPRSVVLPGATPSELAGFTRGDALFSQSYRASQGLGPVYIRAACEDCHAEDGRGPGVVTRMVEVQSDGITPVEAPESLPYGTVVRPLHTDLVSQGVEVPESDPRVRLLLSRRVGPAVFARGWMEALDERAILAEAQAQARIAPSIAGRVPRLSDGRLGRFGLKARVATLEDFAADAFRGDMGLTSARQSTEVPNPEGVTDDAFPGVDLPESTVLDVAAYVRLLDFPQRATPDAEGDSLFAALGCAFCHTPKLPTSEVYSVQAMTAQRPALYTDMLLHDMGAALADGLREGAASEREWRTAPLVGLRFQRDFLHDGRAASLREAIDAHGAADSQSAPSAAAWEALSRAQQARLLTFLEQL